MKKNSIFYSLLSALIALPLLISLSVYSDGAFDPASVRSNSYTERKYNLGVIPDSEEELKTVQSAPPVIRGEFPSQADLSYKMPPVGSQGRQGSCVAWASTYAARSYFAKVTRGWSFGSNVQAGGRGDYVFSPAWTYNQINNGRDSGSSYYNALNLLRDNGVVTWSTWPYSDRDYRKQPSNSIKQQAQKFRLKDYYKLDISVPNNIKAEIAKGNPVCTAIHVYRDFNSIGKKVLDVSTGSMQGGHAIVIVGYDDSKSSPRGHRGAWKIQNSWGKHWGENGFGWISYRHFTSIGKYAYVLIPYGKRQAPSNVDDKSVKAPSTVTATRGTYTNKIIVSWSGVENAVAYMVQRSVGNSGSFSNVGNAQSEEYTDESIQPGVNFRYRIVSIGDSMRSKPENSPIAEGFALRKRNSIPAKVVGFRGTVTGSGSRPMIKLSWNVVAEAQKYSLVKYEPGRKLWKAVYNGSLKSYSDRRPLKGMNCYYIRAINRSGNGDWSDLVKINISARSGPPGKVLEVKGSEGTHANKIVITWDRDPSAKSYGVYRWDNDIEDWDKYFTTTTNNFVDTTPKALAGKPFIYTIKAINDYGESKEWSEYVTGYIRPGDSMSIRSSLSVEPPEGLRSSIDISTGIITITWKKVRNADEYSIYRKEEGDRSYDHIKTVKGKMFRFSEKFPGDPGEVFLYTVRSKIKGSESKKSKVLAGFINDSVPLISTPFTPGDGIKNFVGTWKAVHWVRGSKPVTIEMNITGIGNTFVVTARYGNKKKKTFSGVYAAKSRLLKAGGFSFELIEAFENDVAKVTIAERKLINKNIELNFSRNK